MLAEHHIFYLFALGAVSALAIPEARAAPAQLSGKTILLRWTESREQRAEWQNDFHGISMAQYVTIYVSPTGKLFQRWRTVVGRKSAENDKLNGGSTRPMVFRGNQLEVFVPYVGGIRHVVAGFDGSFSSCSLKVTYASDVAGGPKINKRTLVGHLRVEIRNVSASAEACSLQAGNAFAQ